jgi:hypothetical protein
MFHHRSTVRRSGFRRQVQLWLAACAVAFFCGATPAMTRAEVTAAQSIAAGPMQIWLYNSQNVAVNVTSTQYQGSDGYTYVTLEGNTFPIVINHQEGHVYAVGGGLIGYVTS